MVEMSAVRYMLDEEHARLPTRVGDLNRYILGRMGTYNVAIGYLPQGSQGIGAAAIVATDMRRTFPSIQLRLLVGIGGGIPSKKNDIRLGDVVVGIPDGIHGGVVEYDLGKESISGFERKGFLCQPPNEWTTAVVEMQSDHLVRPNRISEFLSAMLNTYPQLEFYSRPAPEKDILFPPDVIHVDGELSCGQCDKGHIVTTRSSAGSKIFYGTIASGNKVIKNAEIRDRISQSAGGALCFEMEAAGLNDGFPSIIIRGICDYADSHKNDDWHAHAAAVAAACAKELLTYVEPVIGTSGARQFLSRTISTTFSTRLSTYHSFI
jgi:nucleoside phosphorylase